MSKPAFLRPFWRYFGGKWRAAPRYPKPRYGTIVEPFAGAAGYSLRYYERDVVLVEKYEVIAEIWRYLIGVRAAEILSIPEVDHVDDLPAWVPQPARWLVWFHMNAATASPCKSLSSGKRKLRTLGSKSEGWTFETRWRVAVQVGHIRHWKVVRASYDDWPYSPEATWFIDPPYQRAGIHYVHGSGAIDFAALGEWCRERRGQTIVCEAEGADWLPFRPFAEIKAWGAAGKNKTSREVIWTNDNESLREAA